MMRKIRVANTSGFWGDDPGALLRMVKSADIDYLTSDYLAEVSMSVLKKQQRANPDRGFVFDFVKHISPALPLIQDKKIKVLSNAGGNNPRQCAASLEKIIQEQGLDLSIAVLEGDNIFDSLQDLKDQSATGLSNMETGQFFDSIKDKAQSANAYIGVAGLLKALESSADIIIAGRVTDSALVLAPLIHEFGWKLDDWDLLASGMLAAHCIECGSQVCGGNFTDWHLVESWNDMGFPIIEMSPDGSFVVTKPEGSGGLVSVNTVKEQLVYEIADPAHYYSPDVISDLTALAIKEITPNQVLVRGAKGKAPSQYYKVSASYFDGYKAMGELIISGAQALEKAQLFERMFWERFEDTPKKKHTEFVGYNACHGSMASNIHPNEILIRFHIHDDDPSMVKKFCELIASLILSGPQGVAVTGGRPKVQEVFAYWPCLVEKKLVPLSVYYGNQKEGITVSNNSTYEHSESTCISSTQKINLEGFKTSIPLSSLCLARSGDKGNAVNIGVIARDQEAYELIKQYLHPALLKEWFGDMVLGDIKRYEIPGLNAFNFFLESALDGGGTKAMRIDAQGKTMAAALLNQHILVP